MTDEPLTIATYPWPTIDARDLLRRLADAEKRVAGIEESIEDSWGVIANATDWDRDDRKEWRAAAERWRDRYVSGKTFLEAGEVEDVLTMVERTELDAILTGAGIEPRSTIEAVEGGDLVGRVLRLVASRKVAFEQAEAMIQVVKETPAVPASNVTKDEAPATDEAPA